MLGQCNKGIGAKLEAMTNHAVIEQGHDLVGLLKNLQAFTYSYQGQHNQTHAPIEAQKRLFVFRKDTMMSCQDCFEKLKTRTEVVEHFGGPLGQILDLIKNMVSGGTDEDVARAEAREEFLAILFLLGVDPHRFSGVISEVENARIQGRSLYPPTLVEAYKMLLHRKKGSKQVGNQLHTTAEGRSEVAFTNLGGKVDATEATTLVNNSQGGSESNTASGPGAKII